VRTGKAAQLDDAQIAALCAQVPGTVVHADLAAFAEYLIRAERADRGLTGESDSDFGRLE
jgi:D-glycero-D-manno-heptose 1,7-bisphosphate phosphatase